MRPGVVPAGGAVPPEPRGRGDIPLPGRGRGAGRVEVLGRGLGRTIVPAPLPELWLCAR